MRQKIEQYMITPVFNTSALHTGAGMSHAEHHAAIKARRIQILDAIRMPVTDIVARHSGTVIQDGTDYAASGRRGDMVVQVFEQALDELRAIPDTRIEVFHNTAFNLPRTF